MLATTERVFWSEEAAWPQRPAYGPTRRPADEFEAALAATAATGKPLRMAVSVLLDYMRAENIDHARNRLRSRIRVLYPGLRLKAMVLGAEVVIGCVTAPPK